MTTASPVVLVTAVPVDVDVVPTVTEPLSSLFGLSDVSVEETGCAVADVVAPASVVVETSCVDERTVAVESVTKPPSLTDDASTPTVGVAADGVTVPVSAEDDAESGATATPTDNVVAATSELDVLVVPAVVVPVDAVTEPLSVISGDAPASVDVTGSACAVVGEALPTVAVVSVPVTDVPRAGVTSPAS